MAGPIDADTFHTGLCAPERRRADRRPGRTRRLRFSGRPIRLPVQEAHPTRDTFPKRDPWTTSPKQSGKAAAIPKLLSRLTGSGAPATDPPCHPVTDPTWRNYAVRVRHTQDTQINLRSSEALGFLSIFSARNHNHLPPMGHSNSENLILRDPVPHSPDFDITKPTISSLRSRTIS